MADLRTKFCGLDFKNPIVVASAEPTNSVENMKKCIDHGAGGVITKTISDMPAMQTLTKNSKYAILDDKGKIIDKRVPRSFFFYSRSGYVSEHYQEWIPILKETQAYAAANGSHVIGNITSDTMDGWVMLARMIEDCGIPLMEVNFQCPHPTDYDGPTIGNWIAQDAAVTAEVTRRIKAAINIPLMVKLSPEAHNITEIAQAARAAGADSVAVNSRFVGFAVDVDNAEPYIGGPAGIGGPWVKYITLRWIHEIYTKTGIPMSASNGIYDGRDAIEYFMTGADIMQVCSVLMLKGIQFLETIIEEMEKFLDENGYESINAIHGIASKKSKTLPELFEAPKDYCLIDHEKCKFPKCDLCIRTCFYDALNEGGDRVKFTSDNCIGCELCHSVCPFGAITMTKHKELAANA